MLKTFDNFLVIFIKLENCLKSSGCNGSTEDFFGFGCVSIIKPSHPAAIEAYVSEGTQGAQNEA